MMHVHNTVEPVLKDHTFRNRNVVSQDRWCLVTSSIVLKCRTFCQKFVVFQDRWSPMAVVSQDRFHCSTIELLLQRMDSNYTGNNSTTATLELQWSCVNENLILRLP